MKNKECLDNKFSKTSICLRSRVLPHIICTVIIFCTWFRLIRVCNYFPKRNLFHLVLKSSIIFLKCLPSVREGNVFRVVPLSTKGPPSPPLLVMEPYSGWRPPPKEHRIRQEVTSYIPPLLTRSGGHCSGRYASYWNAFLSEVKSLSRSPYLSVNKPLCNNDW